MDRPDTQTTFVFELRVEDRSCPHAQLNAAIAGLRLVVEREAHHRRVLWKSASATRLETSVPVSALEGGLALAATCADSADQASWDGLVSLGVGVSTGALSAISNGPEQSWPWGRSADDASFLAHQAGPASILLDQRTAELASDTLLPTGWELNEIQTLRSVDRGVVLPVCELSLRRRPRGLRRPLAERSQRVRGTVQRWNGTHGFIVSAEDEFFYTDRRYLAGEAEPTTGQTVFFVPAAQPPDKADRNPLATAVLGVGDWIEGEMVDAASAARFIRVRDRAQNHQDVFAHESEFDADFGLGHVVSFRLGTRVQRPVALDVRSRSHERFDGRARRRQAPVPDSVAAVFLDRTTLDLRASGLGALAEDIERLTPPTRAAHAQQQAASRQAVTLTNHLVSAWLPRVIAPDEFYWRHTSKDLAREINDRLAARYLADDLDRLLDLPPSQGPGRQAVALAVDCLRHTAQLDLHDQDFTRPLQVATAAGRMFAAACHIGAIDAPDVEAVAAAEEADRTR